MKKVGTGHKTESKRQKRDRESDQETVKSERKRKGGSKWTKEI
jgi:hypothetical protein